jgi:transcriptional regulator with XRE-family HTH domain/predicted transcriptional regulator
MRGVTDLSFEEWIDSLTEQERIKQKKESLQENKNAVESTDKTTSYDTEYRFRLVGVPPETAIKSIMFDPFEKSIGEIKKQVQEIYGLNPILEIQFIHNGKVLPDHLTFSELGVHPQKDVITVMHTLAGGADRKGAASEFAEKVKEMVSNNKINLEIANRLFAILTNKDNRWTHQKDLLNNPKFEDEFEKLKALAEEIAEQVENGESPEFKATYRRLGALLGVSHNSFSNWRNAQYPISFQSLEKIELIMVTFFSDTAFGDQISALLTDEEVRNQLLHGSREGLSPSTESGMLIIKLEGLFTYKDEETDTDYERTIINHLKKDSRHDQFLIDYIETTPYGVERFKRGDSGLLTQNVLAYLLGVGQSIFSYWLNGEGTIRVDSFTKFDNRINTLFGNLIQEGKPLDSFYEEFKSIIGPTAQERCLETTSEQLLHYLRTGEKQHGPFQYHEGSEITKEEVLERNKELFGYIAVRNVEPYIKNALHYLLENDEFLTDEVLPALEKGFPGDAVRQFESLKDFIGEDDADIKKAVETFRYLLFGKTTSSLQKIISSAEKSHLKVDLTLEQYLRMIYDNIGSSPWMVLLPYTCEKCGHNGMILSRELTSMSGSCKKCALSKAQKQTNAMFEDCTGIQLTDAQIEVISPKILHHRNFFGVYDLYVGRETLPSGEALFLGDIINHLETIGVIIKMPSDFPKWLLLNEIGINVESDGQQHERSGRGFLSKLRLQIRDDPTKSEKLTNILQKAVSEGITVKETLLTLDSLPEIEDFIKTLSAVDKSFLSNEYDNWNEYLENDLEKQKAIEDKDHTYQIRILTYGDMYDKDNVDNRLEPMVRGLLKIIAEEMNSFYTYEELLDELGVDWSALEQFQDGRYYRDDYLES